MARILYVEDEPALAKIVKESLESRGHAVLHVPDGNRVLKAFAEFQPDVCVLDVMQPGTDGFSLGNEIRKSNSQVPILFLTAKNQTADVLKGFKSGGNDYIRKPFSMEELLVRIQNLLNLAIASQTIHHEDRPIGKFSFSPVQQLLRSDRQTHQLSHRESQLLDLLSAKPGAIVSRKDILLQIWGDDSFFNSRTLDVYIKKLRNYLEEDPSVQIITLRGVGYRMVF